MYFFISRSIGATITGIESAQMKRLRLFKQNKKDARIVTVLPFADQFFRTQRYGLGRTEIINMFDYLLDISLSELVEYSVDEYLPHFTSKTIVGSVTRYFEQDALVAKRVKSDSNMQVLSLYRNNRIHTRLTFESRGYLFSKELFDSRRRLLLRQYLDQDCRVRIIEHHDSLIPPTYIYYTKNGEVYHFSGNEEMYSYFFDRLNMEPEFNDNVFIIDRPLNLGWSVVNMKTRAYRVTVLHSIQNNDMTKLDSQDYNFNFREVIFNREQWDAFFTSTESQTNDLRHQLPGQTVYQIPVGTITPLAKENLLPVAQLKNTRGEQKIIVVARIVRGKQIDQDINAFSLIHKKIPTTKLMIYGSAIDTEYFAELKEQIKRLGLVDSVIFKGFVVDMKEAYQDASMMLFLSRYEGSPLGMTESLGNGVPVVAYDFTYGPRDFIESGVNGYITKVGDNEEVARAAVELLSDDKLLEQVRLNALAKSQVLSPTNVWKKWELFFPAVDKFYGKKPEVKKVVK